MLFIHIENCWLRLLSLALRWQLGYCAVQLGVVSQAMLTIGPDTVVKGHIATVGTVVLDGRLEGNICCTRLEIGEGGYLLGKVTAEHVVVNGQVVGEIRGLIVEVMRNAIVEGDVYHTQLSLDEDSTLTGISARIDRLDVPAAMRDVQAVIEAEETSYSVLRRDFAKRQDAEATTHMSEFEQLRAILTKTH